MLEIKDLKVKVSGKDILKGIDLTVRPGEVHAVMGPNGSGKTTLAQVLAGRVTYEVTGGSVHFEGKDLLVMKPEDRAREGVFMAFQYPVEIPGVSNAYFLKAALNAIRKYRGLEEIDAMDFVSLVQDKAKLLDGVAKANYKWTTLEYKNPTVKVVGPAAIVRFNFVGEQEFADGKKTPQNLAILMNWQKQGSDWKLLSRAATKL